MKWIYQRLPDTNSSVTALLQIQWILDPYSQSSC